MKKTHKKTRAEELHVYDAKKCEWVSECTLLWKDACYLNKRPTIMCLAKNKTKQN